jgi:hypothetical protein
MGQQVRRLSVNRRLSKEAEPERSGTGEFKELTDDHDAKTTRLVY